jgi:UDP-N-acetylmuramate--alanine ligase
MSGLALVAHRLGASITGSDRAPRRRLGRLRELGVEVSVGHAPGNVPPGAELVYSAVVAADNPERQRGRELGARELRRGELLAELSRMRRCIAVAGTHGKSTTAAMIVEGLRGAGWQVSYVIGTDLCATGSNAEWTEGDWLVVEADESDRSFLALNPDIAVVTNIELEHRREYASRIELDEAFRAFLARPRHAVVWDRPELLALRNGPVVPFDARAATVEPGGSGFQWRELEVRVPVPGLHNAQNAAAALEACCLTGADPTRTVSALARFSGTSRRFEFLGITATGAELYDDYAHHPTEVRATLIAARPLARGRLVAVLQPHGRERVETMADAFAEALSIADLVVVLEVYLTRAGANAGPAPTAATIARAAAATPGDRTVAWIPSADAAERYLRAELRAGDLCVTLGSGDVDVLARRLVNR